MCRCGNKFKKGQTYIEEESGEVFIVNDIVYLEGWDDHKIFPIYLKVDRSAYIGYEQDLNEFDCDTVYAEECQEYPIAKTPLWKALHGIN